MEVRVRIAMNRTLAAAAILASAIACATFSARAQAPDPVQWLLTAKSPAARPGGKLLASLTATIQPGWHLYSMTTPKGGPNATTVKLVENPAAAGIDVFQPQPERKYDANFKLGTETFTKEVPLLVEVALKPSAPAGAVDVELQIRYQACQDTLCLPPKTKTAKVSVKVDPDAPAQSLKIAAGYAKVLPR
jgi:DsbC/DsbD-like thiol-disulfide interchange protein